MYESYELPEPVELKAGEMYMMGFEDGVPFVRLATDEERREWGSLNLLTSLKPSRATQPVVPQRDMTATFLSTATNYPGLWASGEADLPS